MAAAYSLGPIFICRLWIVRYYMDSLRLAWIVHWTSCHSMCTSWPLRATFSFNRYPLLAILDIAGAAWAPFWRGRSKFFHPTSML